MLGHVDVGRNVFLLLVVSADERKPTGRRRFPHPEEEKLRKERPLLDLYQSLAALVSLPR